MGRRGKVESKRVDRGRFREVGKCSDESDEDYTVDNDEGIEESEDEYVSSAEDETEDSLGEFEVKEEQEEEEEELVEKKVKKVSRPKIGIRSRKSNGFVTLRKRKFSSSKKTDVDSDEFDGGKRNRITNPAKNKSVSYRPQERFCCDVSHEHRNGQRNGALKQKKKRKVSYIEEDSGICDDTDDTDDEEFTPDEVDDYVDDEDDDYVDDEDEVSYRLQERFCCDVSHEHCQSQRNGAVKQKMKRKVSYIEEDSGICDDTDDTDDEEFTPDEVDDEDDDYVDDEDEVIDLKRNKQSARPRKQGQRNSKGRQRYKDFRDLKNSKRKKPGKNRSFAKKRVHHGTPVEQKKLKSTGRQQRSSILNSDSDFELEFEYTVSEEEREQIRETKKFRRDVTNTLRSSAPMKKLTHQESVHPRKSSEKKSEKKGKEKDYGLKTETGKQVCGICLSEEGKRTVRGVLNCCSHYFCFACIMEWSKVESRCPVCKQRFITISKSARSNALFDLRTSTIQVPERDQVYQPSEEELRGYLDPYENVICTECLLGGDDSLMLLCDICDSPAHTYCVGLGYDVPEGNWYCHGCRPMALYSLNPQGLDPIPDDRVNLSVGSSPMASVRETFDLNEAYVPDTPISNGNEQPSPRLSVGDLPASSPASGAGVLTVRSRRRIQNQIRQMINNRRQQDSETSGSVPSVSGSRLLGSQLVGGGVLDTQHMEFPRRSISSYTVPFHGRSEANTRHTRQTGNPFIARLTTLQSSTTQRQASTSNDVSHESFLQNEFTGSNTILGTTLGNLQVQSRGSRPNI